jgi:glycolate oxidase iron-sulfur subunit
MENTATLKRKVSQCVRCGQCRFACPIFREAGVESTVARGKLALLRDYLEGKDAPMEEISAILSKCLLCKTCSSQCPSGVHADELILAGRELAATKVGISPVKKAVFAVLRRRVVFDLCLTAVGLFQDLGIKRNTDGRLGAIQRFPMPGLSKRRVISPFAVKSLRRQLPEVVRVSNAKARVAFFTGCMANYVYTDSGKATVDILTANGIEVVLPKMQHCCGFPLFTSGDVDSGKLLARHNIDIFVDLDVDAVITVCGSCGSAWRHEYARLLADEPVYMEKIARIAKKTYDVAEYLTEVQPMDPNLLGEVKMTVTIHDPCHLGRGLGVTKQVRKLITAIPGVKLKEMKDPGRCCGAGGSFNLSYYELSRDINDRKLNDIASTTADVVITGCGSCRMHLIDGLCQREMPQNVLHTTQLIAKAIAAKQKKQLEESV